MKCRQCPEEIEADEELCPACEIELACRVLAADPRTETTPCGVCGAAVSFIEARVLRFHKNPSARASHITPKLCWVCARLHLSALKDAPRCAVE